MMSKIITETLNKQTYTHSLILMFALLKTIHF